MAGRVNVFPLAGIQVSSLQQSEHAQNAVEGRAQLMTHVCQKLALAPVRLLCCCIGCLQTFGQLLQSLAFFFLPVLAPCQCCRSQQQDDQLRHDQHHDVTALRQHG